MVIPKHEQLEEQTLAEIFILTDGFDIMGQQLKERWYELIARRITSDNISAGTISAANISARTIIWGHN